MYSGEIRESYHAKEGRFSETIYSSCEDQESIHLLHTEKKVTRYSRIRQSRGVAVVVMFIAFLLDIMLLTVVEPVLPDILRSSKTTILTVDLNNNSRTLNETEVDILQDEVSALEIGILNGAKPFVQVIFNLFIGHVVDRVGHSLTILVGFISAFISTLGFAFSNQFLVLLIFRCIQGLGSSLITISSMTMVSQYYKDETERGKAMSIGMGGLAIGLVIGFPMGSILYQFAGREMPFLIMAGLIFAGAFIRFCFMEIQCGRLEQMQGQGHCSEMMAWADIYIVIAAGVYFWECFGCGTVMAHGPLYMTNVLQSEQWQIGVIFLVGAISQLFLQNGSPWIAPKAGRWLISMIGLFLVALGLSSYPLASSTWLLLLPQVVFSGGLGLIMASIPAMLSQLADLRAQSRYGSVFALADTGTNLGYFLGSFVNGILVNNYGFLWPFLGSGCLLLAYSFLCIFLRNVPSKEKQYTGLM